MGTEEIRANLLDAYWRQVRFAESALNTRAMLGNNTLIRTSDQVSYITISEDGKSYVFGTYSKAVYFTPTKSQIVLDALRQNFPQLNFEAVNHIEVAGEILERSNCIIERIYYKGQES